MSDDLGKFYDDCATCMKLRGAAVSTDILVSTRVDGPLKSIFFDYIGPLPEQDGMKYVLVVIDRFSHWTLLTAAKDVSARTTVDSIIRRWIMQVGTVFQFMTTDGSKNCNLPIIKWRFVTAMAKGEPHHWTTLGGDSQTGELQVMFDGARVDRNYDPMRKQGAILLGNGGDNSNGSQGTFYEGAMTAAGTFPTDASPVVTSSVIFRYSPPELNTSVISSLVPLAKNRTRASTESVWSGTLSS